MEVGNSCGPTSMHFQTMSTYVNFGSYPRELFPPTTTNYEVPMVQLPSYFFGPSVVS